MIIKYNHLLGREWVHGEQDCYTLLQDMYRDNLGLELTNYARPTDWWTQGMDLYTENFAKEGFFKVSLEDQEPHQLDVFMISIPDPRCFKNVVNHCAVYVGDGLVVHHLGMRLSECTRYRGYLSRYTSYVIRHNLGPKLLGSSRVSPQVLDLMTLIPLEKQRGLLNVSN